MKTSIITKIEHAFLNQIENDIKDNDFENYSSLMQRLLRNKNSRAEIIDYLSHCGIDNIQNKHIEMRYNTAHLRQVEMYYKLQDTGFNIITCGNCGEHLIVDIESKKYDEIECTGCNRVMSPSDCPDLYY